MAERNEWIPFDLPCGIEAAANRLAAATKADGYECAIVMVRDGRICNVQVYDKDDNQHFLSTFSSTRGGKRETSWYELVTRYDDGCGDE